MTAASLVIGLLLSIANLLFAIKTVLRSRRNLERALRAEYLLAMSASLCSACGDPPPSGAHEHGWRFETCADGDPRWRCGECRRGDVDPVQR